MTNKPDQFFSSEATIARTLERIAALNPSVNAFITVLEADALSQARALDEERRQGRSRGPCHGLPISIKDIIDVKGVPTTAASHVRAGHVAQADAPVVARLREAGAVIIGKCNLHEFALGTTSDESAFGPAHNPHDLSRSPGGSSGGSAAAVAAGMGWASIGTDTGGSIRIPAAVCGVVGLKPAFGEIPTAGVVPLSVSLDHVGPIARTVSDAWAVYEALRGMPEGPKTPALVHQIRLGKLGAYFLEQLDDEVRMRFDDALDRLRAAGATIVDATIPHARDIPSIYIKVALPEAAAYHAKTLQSMPDAYSEGVAGRLAMGFNVPREDYLEAQADRVTLKARVEASLAKCDALVLPTLPMPAPLIGASTVLIGGKDEPIRPLMLRLTQLFNLTGHPAISLPCGSTEGGLPCGLQLVGRHEGTVDLLSLSLAFETLVTPRGRQSSADY
ncbi:MAG: amidase [Acidobacteria bacterium]|nr:amidase [Acidobacteriota bacterium]